MLEFQNEPEMLNVSKIYSNKKLYFLNRYQKSAPTTPMIEFFLTFLIGWKMLTNATKRFILDVVIFLDTPLYSWLFYTLFSDVLLARAYLTKMSGSKGKRWWKTWQFIKKMRKKDEQKVQKFSFFSWYLF